MLASLKMRRRERRPEIMDDPALEPERHRRALHGLARVNRWSDSAGILWPALREAARRNGRRALRVLDIATGGGDVPIRLWRRARASGVPFAIDGCDVSSRAVEHARESADRAAAEVGLFVHDALAGDLPTGYDVLISSLFLHHLDDGSATTLLRAMAAAASRMILINDLRRSPAGLALAYLGTRLLLTSDVVRSDGVLSVRAAFTLREVREVTIRAGLSRAKINRRAPCRFLLEWRRP
ncbi:MAG: methyltransferase domain-containing protein [Planctomycetes bacterium]|nr:methyltransferase domain-containing protein [Planctomycetota bacterium]